MSDQEELRAELIALVEDTRRHIAWMQDAGIRTMKRIAEAGPAPSSQVRAPPPSDRARPAWGADAAPVKPTPPPPRPAPPAPQAASPAVRPAFAPTPAPVAAPPVPAPVPAPKPVAAVAAPVAAAPVQVADPARALTVIRDDLGDCQRCKLASGRKKLVYGQGNPRSEIVFLGEGPGEEEDLSGLAFVGRAGQLLTKMIEGMGYTRDDVYICNVVKCRPPNNRPPEPDEVQTCRPFAERQILAIRPKVIVTLGATATKALLRTEVGITKLRNTWQVWQGIPVMPTFHPSYLLRAPDEKGKAWEDLKLVLAKLGREVPRRK